MKVIRSEGPKQSGLLRVAARGRAGGPNGLQTQIGFLLGCPRRPNVVYGTSLEAVRKPVDVAEGEPNSVTASAEENALEHNVMLRLATAWLTVVGKSMGGVIARIERRHVVAGLHGVADSSLREFQGRRRSPSPDI